MKFGIFLNVQNSPSEPLNKTVREGIERTRAAREAGFDMVCPGGGYQGGISQTKPLVLPS